MRSALHDLTSMTVTAPCPISSAANGCTSTAPAPPVFNPSTRRHHRRSARCAAPMWSTPPSKPRPPRFPPGATRRRSSARGSSSVTGSCSRKISIASAQSVSREHGKTLVEARGSVYRGIENIEFACGIPSLLMGDTLENIARGVDCETMHQPLGVCVGITPFNFPGDGAAVDVPARPRLRKYVRPQAERKSSAHRRSCSSNCSKKPACPKACSTSCTAGANASMRCSRIRRCRAISFVGSTPIAKYIYETGTRHGKRVQANGGAKNYIVVMPDADVAKTVEALSTAAFGCAGERCMAGSTAITVGDAAEQRSALARRSRARDQSRPDRSRSAARHGPGHHRAASRPRAEPRRQRREGRREDHLPTAAA